MRKKLYKWFGIHDWMYSCPDNGRYTTRHCAITGKIQQRGGKRGNFLTNTFDDLFPHWFDLL